MKRKYCLLVIAVLIITRVLTDSVYAQEFSLGVYPPVIQATTLPPTVIKPKITISNKTDSELNLLIRLKPFRPTGKGDGSITYPNSTSLPEYLIFPLTKIYDGENSINSISLRPKETKDLTIQIDIDRDTPLADYYFSVLFISDSESEKEEQNIKIPAGIATNVILAVGQNRSKSIKIESFKAPKIVGSGPVPFTVLIKNSGEHLITPSAKIEVKNMFGKIVGTVPLLPEYVLSSSTRYLVEEDYASRSADTVARLNKSGGQYVSLFNKNFLFGKYEAKVTGFLMEDSSVTFSQNLAFYALPVPYIIGFILTIVILIIIVSRVKHLKKKDQ